ncbi:hypothetical protein AB0K57_33035, partial [Streptomyces halstedii]
VTTVRLDTAAGLVTAEVRVEDGCGEVTTADRRPQTADGHQELQVLVYVCQFSGQVEAQPGKEIVKLGVAQAGVLGPAGSRLAGLRASGAFGGSLGSSSWVRAVSDGDERVAGIRGTVGDDGEVDVDAVAGESAPGFGDLLQDGRTAGGTGFGEVLLVDGCGAADGVLDLAVRTPIAMTSVVASRSVRIRV